LTDLPAIVLIEVYVLPLALPHQLSVDSLPFDMASTTNTGGNMVVEEQPFELVAYAQNAEDVVLIRAFTDWPSGFFVDIGAGDPCEGSLTKNLSDRLGWRGINVEPQPDMFARLCAARPNDINLCLAVGSKPGMTCFYRLYDNQGMSTLCPTVATSHRVAGWSIEELQVEVVTLEHVLAAYAKPEFDLLKIDVEGMEIDVLASFDLTKWRPRVLVIEATVPGTRVPSHQEWEPEVLAAGYQLALFDGLNRFYARNNEPVLRERLSVPANVFDRWISARWLRLLEARERSPEAQVIEV
jgi:FkbM family methyltransferase